MDWKIPLFKTYSDKDDVDAVSKVIKRGTFWADGPEVKEFEKEISKYIGTRYSLVFNSGTSALHALLEVYDVKDQEVIVPSFTFISTVNSVILANGIPVFAESEEYSSGLDYEDVKNKITNKTKAIIALHYAGKSSRDIVKLKELAKEKNIILIEDAAESMGAKRNNQMVGTFGDAAMFSFCQNKIITTGEGGAIVTDSRDIYEKLKLLRSHGRVEFDEGYFNTTKDNDYIRAGYNFRLSTMGAALGLSQLRKIDYIIDKRRFAANYLRTNLNSLPEVITPKDSDGDFDVYQIYTIKLPNKEIRDGLQAHLEIDGIMAKVYFTPTHLKSLYKNNYGCKEGDLPITEAYSDKVLTLPFYPHISIEELDQIIKSIKNFFEERK